MADVTLRNIPEELLKKLRTLSALKRRSLNSQILATLEEGLTRETYTNSRISASLPKDDQLAIWENLCGRWQDNRQEV